LHLLPFMAFSRMILLHVLKGVGLNPCHWHSIQTILDLSNTYVWHWEAAAKIV
jgi:hypothetical protein